MTIDASAFDFGAMKEALGGVDPFAADAKRYQRDERFYMLQKDKDGNGAALIRFLPDSERAMIQKMFKINTTITTNGKKRFVSEYSPSIIGMPCPFQEKWQTLWNVGDKETAKLYSRGIRYVTNIKVIKDPQNPENEGKNFMYEISSSMKEKIQNAVDPSEQDRSLGAKPKEIFNPIKGNSFRLVAKKGTNNQINYDSSEVINEVTSIYDTVEAAIADIAENSYLLSDLLKPESFMSYDELVNKLEWVESKVPSQTDLNVKLADAPVQVAEVQNVEAKVETKVETKVEAKVEPAQPSTSLDDMLAGLV